MESTVQSSVIEAVRKILVVEVPIDHAFQSFTARFAEWWPTTHHIGKQPYEAAFIEPRNGGRWYERATDGTECDWGSVLAWEPPLRILFSWHLGHDWQYNSDIGKASEVEVQFVSEGTQRTRIELEHRHLERHGEGADTLRTSLDSPGGWTLVLDGFRALCER